MKRQLEQLRNWGAALLLGLTSAMLANAGTSTGFSPIITVDTTGQAPPDLTVENVRFTPASVSIGGAVTVSFRVRNLSGRTAEAPVVRVRLTSDAALTESDPRLLPLDVTLPTLAAGTAYDYSGSFSTVPGTLLPSSYSVGVRVDPLNQLGQKNTANDTAVSVAKLGVVGTGGPSLVVSPANRVVNAEASSTAFSIYNTGGGTMAWTASISAAPWLHFSGGSSAGIGSGTTGVTCDANTSTSPRTGTIVFSAPAASPASVSVTVTQPGAAVPQPPVTTFQFSSISSPKAVNTPFAVTVQAMNGAVVQTGFNGEVQLSAESGGNVNLRTIRLVNGLWSGNLSLDTVAPQERLVASTTTGTRVEGKSNPFAVQAPGASSISVTVIVKMWTGVPVSGATVSLWRDNETPIPAVSDASGKAVFLVAGAGFFNFTALKGDLRSNCEFVEVSGKPVSKVVIMNSPKPPVILVPGMMGSCSEVGGVKYPLLHRGYPARRDSLKLFHPYLDWVGWKKLAEKLNAAGFSVFQAPWDWRMAAIKPEDGKVAWKEYLLPVIACAKAATGSQKVDIVAHSMGGLLTRAYIQSDEYAGDINRFAMVGTPNEGSANTYYLWFGGDTTSQEGLGFYDGASQYNYQEWTGGEWGGVDSKTRLQFYRDHIKSLEELLPVYPYVLIYEDGRRASFPEVDANPLFRLNQKALDVFKPPCATDKVCTKVFYSESEDTIHAIRVNSMCASSGLYPHGKPVGKPLMIIGDETVTVLSAKMFSAPFTSVGDSSGGAHSQLVGAFATPIRDFLTEGRSMMSLARTEASDPGPDLATNQLLIAISGRTQPWMTDPSGASAGISPSNGLYTNGWGQTTVEVEARSAAFLRDNPPLGNYSGRLAAFPGETVELTAASSPTGTTIVQGLRWVGTTNEIQFGLQQAASGSNAVSLATELPAPQNLWSFSGDGTCALTWDALTNSNVAAYRIYARRKDESLYAALGTVTNPPFSTGHSWDMNSAETNWFYAVVAVSTNGTESPYADTVMNFVPTLAKFSVDLTSGTPPLSVAFADQSTGGITNWAWDFNSDGITDSTEQNPVASFSQLGTYTVTLSVSGPNGEDTQVRVGCIEVVLPSLSAIRVLTNQTVELTLTGQAGRSYEIQRSPDLAAWTSLTNILPTESVTPFVDAAATNQSARFYRAVVP